MKLVNICNNCQLVTMNGRTIIFSYGTPVLSVEWMGGAAFSFIGIGVDGA